jgi:hypothetical protein
MYRRPERRQDSSAVFLCVIIGFIALLAGIAFGNRINYDPAFLVLCVVASFVSSVSFALGAGFLAEKNGREFWVWFLVSLFCCSWFGLIILLLLGPVGSGRRYLSKPKPPGLKPPQQQQPPAPPADARFPCPQCGESIPVAAKVCRFCQAEIR